MSKKILKVASLGLIGGKKKAAPAQEEKKGPVITPLAQARQLDQRQRGRLRPAPTQTLLGGDSSKLGG